MAKTKITVRTCVVAVGKHEKKLQFEVRFHRVMKVGRDAHADESEDLIRGIYQSYMCECLTN
jgi:hypothetical protein